MSSWYERNKARVIAKNAQTRRETQEWFREHKKTLSCIQCGQNHPATLDFHHVVRRPDNRKMRDLLKNGVKSRILEELAKCVVLCANCHRIHHWNERVDKHADTPTIHIPSSYTRGKTMLNKLKSLFTGKDTKAEEKKEATALKTGQISKSQYVAGEKAEQKKEGEKKPVAQVRKNANQIKSGKMSPAQYANKEARSEGARKNPTGAAKAKSVPAKKGAKR